MNNGSLVKLNDVHKTYRTGEMEVPAVRGVSLEIKRSEFVALMGASGSGKSTLMNILGCLDRPTSGAYRFLGQDVSGFGRDELARLRREAFGFVFQSYNLIAGATAAENVEVPAAYAGTAPGPRRADRAGRGTAARVHAGAHRRSAVAPAPGAPRRRGPRLARGREGGRPRAPLEPLPHRAHAARHRHRRGLGHRDARGRQRRPA